MENKRNKSGNPDDWIIKDTGEERLEDMRETFKEIGVFMPVRNIIK